MYTTMIWQIQASTYRLQSYTVYTRNGTNFIGRFHYKVNQLKTRLVPKSGHSKYVSFSRRHGTVRFQIWKKKQTPLLPSAAEKSYASSYSSAFESCDRSYSRIIRPLPIDCDSWHDDPVSKFRRICLPGCWKWVIFNRAGCLGLWVPSSRQDEPT